MTITIPVISGTEVVVGALAVLSLFVVVRYLIGSIL